MLDATGSAAAPAARLKNVRRGSFTFIMCVLVGRAGLQSLSRISDTCQKFCRALQRLDADGKGSHQSGLSSLVGNENQLARRSAEPRSPLYRMHVTGSPRDSNVYVVVSPFSVSA